MLPSNKPPMASSSKGAVDFLTKKPDTGPIEVDDGDEGSDCASECQALVAKYGKAAVMADLESLPGSDPADVSPDAPSPWKPQPSKVAPEPAGKTTQGGSGRYPKA